MFGIALPSNGDSSPVSLQSDCWWLHPSHIPDACLLPTQALVAAVEHFVDMIFLRRLRTPADRHAVAAVLETVWGRPLRQHWRPSMSLDPDKVRVGRAVVPRASDAAAAAPRGLRVQNGSLRALEAVMQV